jgi:hypothetical protein
MGRNLQAHISILAFPCSFLTPTTVNSCKGKCLKQQLEEHSQHWKRLSSADCQPLSHWVHLHMSTWLDIRESKE